MNDWRQKPVSRLGPKELKNVHHLCPVVYLCQVDGRSVVLIYRIYVCFFARFTVRRYRCKHRSVIV